MSDSAREKGRLAVYAMAGVYVLYMAYTIFKNLPERSESSFLILVIAMIFFLITGVGLIVFSMTRTYKIRKKEWDAQKKEEE